MTAQVQEALGDLGHPSLLYSQEDQAHRLYLGIQVHLERTEVITEVLLVVMIYYFVLDILQLINSNCISYHHLCKTLSLGAVYSLRILPSLYTMD